MQLNLEKVFSENKEFIDQIREEAYRDIVVWYSKERFSSLDDLDLTEKSRQALEAFPYKHRFYYYSCWDKSKLAKATYVMLNPSTASHMKTDPTINNCLKIARESGYGCLEIVNIYSSRHPNSDQIKREENEINSIILTKALSSNSTKVLAWGKDVNCKNINYINLRNLLKNKEMMVIDGKYPRHPSPLSLNRLKKIELKKIQLESIFK